MKQKLTDHYVDEVSFSKFQKLKRKEEKIIDNFYKDLRSESIEEGQLRIIETAAQLIRDEIKSVKEVYVGKNYPPVTSMTF